MTDGMIPAMELFGRNKVDLTESEMIRNCIQWCLSNKHNPGDRAEATDAMKHYKVMYGNDPKADQYRYRTVAAKLNGVTGYGIVLYVGEKLYLVHFVGASRAQDIICAPKTLAARYEKEKAKAAKKAGKATESFMIDDFANEGTLANVLLSLGDEAYFDL